MKNVLGCNQSKRPLHSFVFLVALGNGVLPMILSCWCYINQVIICFFTSPSCTDPHEHFSSQTQGQLFVIKSSLFFQELLFKPGSVRSTTLNRNFSISFWIFGLIVVSKVKYLFTVYQSGFYYLWLLLLLLLTLRIFFSEL